MAAGDKESFTQWATERQGALLRTAVLISGDHQRAEDLVQEALTKVALRWGKLRDGHPDAYARTIIARDNISWWRRHRRELVGLPEHGDREAPRSGASSERQLMLRDALAALTAKQRAVIVLRFYDDLTEPQAADVLGVAVGTVKSQTHLALRRLREAAPELAELLTEDS
ncbi:SigE family RNA polymerase sigma factor [Nocardioides jensenii]|uniref:SigE family RNA polymerase sigma factor n=1 Tax=Nocardioides jensenii TaxID=1843 RepID=UPI0008307860|nr:SigE family RNA polymerase sigma factor [Nocardioides jensenii]